jgi:hypothetical protein
LYFGYAATAKADPIAVSGSQAFANLGLTTANGSATGNIDTATTFSLSALISTLNSSGIFAGMPTQMFAPIMFSTTAPASLAFGNSVFGSFQSATIAEVALPSGFANIVANGTWIPGSYGGVTGGPSPAMFELALSQTPPTDGAISASATFATTEFVTEIPEPTTTFMVLSGLVLALTGWRFRGRMR